MNLCGGPILAAAGVICPSGEAALVSKNSTTRTALAQLIAGAGAVAFVLPSAAQTLGSTSPTLGNPILFVTQVPVEQTTNTVTSVGGNHLATTAAAPRGGDLMIRYPDRTLKNLTRLAGYGESETEQGANAIAVRDPCVHWSGQRALFSMVIGTAGNARWQIYKVTGLGPNESPFITRVPNQPADYNNVAPCYSSTDGIIFISDRPRTGAAHLYPARDEKGQGEINTGLWLLEPATGTLTHLEHSPSGSFDPLVDRFGRIVFSRWDHLQRDEATSAGAFDFPSEESGVSGSADVWSDLFPDPLPSRTTPLGLKFDHFFPWTLNQDGTGLVTINHLGRHELSPAFKSSRADSNLKNFTPPDGAVRAGSFLQIGQVPSSTSGRFVAVDAVFSAVSAGRLVTFVAPPRRPAERGAAMVTLTNTGLARDPGVLADGRLIASLPRISTTPLTGYYGRTTPTPILLPPDDPVPLPPDFIPAISNPGSVPPDFIPTTGNPFKIVVTPPLAFDTGILETINQSSFVDLTDGIIRTVTNPVGGQARTFSGALWELQPAEVAPTPRPPVTTTSMDTPELDVFLGTGVSPTALREWLKANELALISVRNVTARDAADRQQPTNLRVDGGVETVAPGEGPVYTVSGVQFFQADYVRGYGLTQTDHVPDVGRRVAARPMHGDKGANPTTARGAGHVNVSTDGSIAAFVPATRGLSWELEDSEGNALVRERYWLSFQAGEIRSCTSCHEVNSLDQAGHTVATNPPRALRELLESWKQIHPEAEAGSYRIWSEVVTGKPPDPAGDIDGDGATNFEEFAVGSSPLTPPAAGQRKNPLEVTRQILDGKELNTLTFTRSMTVHGLAIALETSDDMASWEAVAYFDVATQSHPPTFTLEITPSSNGQTETIRLTELSIGSARSRYYRLRIEAP